VAGGTRERRPRRRRADASPLSSQAPLRKLADNVELKSMDATANPHLALAAIIAAGLDGVRNARRLAPPVGSDTAAFGAPPPGGAPPPARLPDSAAAAADALELGAHAGPLGAVVGETVVAALVAQRRADAAAVDGWDHDRLVRELALTF